MNNHGLIWALKIHGVSVSTVAWVQIPWVFVSVSEERIDSVFRICRLWSSLLWHIVMLRMITIFSVKHWWSHTTNPEDEGYNAFAETLVTNYETGWRYNPNDSRQTWAKFVLCRIFNIHKREHSVLTCTSNRSPFFVWLCLWSHKFATAYRP